MQIIKPPRLHQGDTVGLVSPSQSVNDRLERFHQSIPIFEKELGIKTKLSDHALGEYWDSSGTIDDRVADFHAMIADPRVKAVIFTVGGFTAVDLLPRLDYELIKNNPKIICGVSDNTTLLNPIFARTGLVTFHGLEFSHLGYPGHPAYMLDSLRHNFFAKGAGEIRPNPAWRDVRGTPTSYTGWNTIRAGVATGRLIGGNMSALFNWLNTPYSPDLTGAILFVEAYKFDKRMIHNALSNYRLRGVFDQIAGLIVGYCVGSDDPDKAYNTRSMKEVVLETVGDYSFPVMQIGEIGHYVENALMPIGATATMDSNNLRFKIEEEVTI